MARFGVDGLFEARGKWWCHLICDDFSPAGIEELHSFAERIGAARRSFHDPAGDPRPHYDLTPELRESALQAGALPLDTQEFVRFLRLGRERRQSPSG